MEKNVVGKSLARRLLFEDAAAAWSPSDFNAARAQILSFGKRDLSLAVRVLKALYKKASKEYLMYWKTPHVLGRIYPMGHSLNGFENKEMAVSIAVRCHELYVISETLREYHLQPSD